MHPRILVRLGGGLLVVAGLLLTVQAVAQRQASPTPASSPREEGSAAPVVRFQGHLRNELVLSRIESLRQTLAGEPASQAVPAARTVQPSAGAEGVELMPERANIAIVRPTEDGAFEVICEESPASARATLTAPAERLR